LVLASSPPSLQSYSAIKVTQAATICEPNNGRAGYEDGQGRRDDERVGPDTAPRSGAV
jgi:hypothetical protein